MGSVPLFIALAHVVQQDVVLQSVGDEPSGVSVFSTVLDPVLLLGKLEELLHGDGLGGGHHQQTWRPEVKEAVQTMEDTPTAW